MSIRSGKSSGSLEFFSRRPVFTHREFVGVHTAAGQSKHKSNSLLAKHLAGGRILRIRRGLRAAVPLGSKPEPAPRPDLFLVATRQRDDGRHRGLDALGPRPDSGG